MKAHTDLNTPIIINGSREDFSIRKNYEAFVDDTDCYAESHERSDEAEKEVISLQWKSQSWSKLIPILGGVI